jgi:hypothetical protein
VGRYSEHGDFDASLFDIQHAVTGIALAEDHFGVPILDNPSRDSRRVEELLDIPNSGSPVGLVAADADTSTGRAVCDRARRVEDLARTICTSCVVCAAPACAFLTVRADVRPAALPQSSGVRITRGALQDAHIISQIGIPVDGFAASRLRW